MISSTKRAIFFQACAILNKLPSDIQIQVAGDPDSSCWGSRFKLLGIQIQVAGDPVGSRFKLLGIQIQVARDPDASC